MTLSHNKSVAWTVLFGVALLFAWQTALAFSPTIPSVSEAIQKEIKKVQVDTTLIQQQGVLGDPVAAPYFDLHNPENGATLAADDLRFQWGDVQPTDDALSYYVLILKKIVAPGVTSDVFAVEANKDVRTFTPTTLSPGEYEWFMRAMDASDNVLFTTEKRTFSIIPDPVLGEPLAEPSSDPADTADATSTPSATEDEDVSDSPVESPDATGSLSSSPSPSTPTSVVTHQTENVSGEKNNTPDSLHSDTIKQQDKKTSDNNIAQTTQKNNMTLWVLGLLILSILFVLIYKLGRKSTRGDMRHSAQTSMSNEDATSDTIRHETSEKEKSVEDHK